MNLMRIPYIICMDLHPWVEIAYANFRADTDEPGSGTEKMGKILKYLVGLAVLGLVTLIGYGYLVDMSPEQGEKRVPVMLDGG